MSVPDTLQAALDLFQQGQYRESRQLCRRLLRSGPQDPEIWQLAAGASIQLGQYERAAGELKSAISLVPRQARFRGSLASLYLAMGDPLRALRLAEQACRLSPGDVRMAAILGRACVAAGRSGRAIEVLEPWRTSDRDLVREPLAQAYALEGAGRTAAHRYLDAVQAYANALDLGDRRPGVLSNLGIAHSLAGEHARAMGCFREAIAADPAFLPARSNLLLASLYRQELTPAQIAGEHRKHGRAWEGAGRAIDRPARRRSSRKLRIGYVSGDFRRHPVSRFIEPILRAHDRGVFEVFCYSSAPITDGVTRRLQRTSGHWRWMAEMNDAEAARQIQVDRCDILIDLSGHTQGNRLGVFALRPAPVQVTYLGYPATTGLRSMQYRITDHVCDPPGLSDGFHTESLVRLDGCFLCYRPNPGAPPPEPSPQNRTCLFTFGCLNHHPKLSSETITLWAEILRQTPGTQLLLKSRSLSDAGVAAAIRTRFEQYGIAADRLELRGFVASERAHLATYQEVDLALDPFPYNGTTTTCEALWMGTPVIAMVGDAHVSRVGASLLSAAGLAGLIAASADEYLRTAVTLARNPERIRRLRIGLRRQIARSALCDAAQFTRRFEAALIQMRGAG